MIADEQWKTIGITATTIEFLTVFPSLPFKFLKSPLRILQLITPQRFVGHDAKSHADI
jgi:hypothetical protein